MFPPRSLYKMLVSSVVLYGLSLTRFLFVSSGVHKISSVIRQFSLNFMVAVELLMYSIVKTLLN